MDMDLDLYPDPSYIFKRVHTYVVVKSILNKIKYASAEIQSKFWAFSKGDLRKLEQSLCFIITSLTDEEQMSLDGSDSFLFRLKEVAYDIEDLLDEGATHELEHKVQGKNNLKTGRFPSDMKILLASLEEIVLVVRETTSIYSLKPKPMLSTEITSYKPNPMQSTEIIIGREGEIERLIQLIISSHNNQYHPIVITVSGPGGIGKTTLVKLVCGDSRVISNFDLVSWSTDDKILRKPANFNPQTYNAQSFNAHAFNAQTFKEYCRNRKFLLVVDDIIDVDLPHWRKKLEPLDVGSRGSIVILIAWSTINIGALTERFIHEVEVEGLPETECWSLFKRYAAFGEDEEVTHSSLKDIGRSIVNKCGGSPLAVKSLASLLRNNRDIHCWQQIDQSKLWDHNNNQGWTAWFICLQVLPAELILCCATLPMMSTYNFSTRDRVVWFWMAQGLLQPTYNNEDLTDIGIRFCEILEDLNFLSLQPDGDPVCLLGCYFVHCLSLEHIDHVKDNYIHSTGENLISIGDKSKSLEYKRLATSLAGAASTDRHDSLQYKRRAASFDRRSLSFAVTTRSYSPMNVNIPSLKEIIYLKYLRVLLLQLDKFESSELLEHIGNLKLLRYLSLSCNLGYPDRVLPKSICRLVNLQTLDLSMLHGFSRLPRYMHKLVNLRHLLLSRDFLAPPPKQAFTTWTSLHHLQISDTDLRIYAKAIEDLTAVRTLEICNCDSMLLCLCGINYPNRLERLDFCDCAFQTIELKCWNGFRYLRSLKFERLPRLVNLPDGLQSAADSLEHLVINDCRVLDLAGWNDLRHLRNLKSLRIKLLPQLCKFPDGLQSAANSLEHLVIASCENLTMLPESLQHCTCLVEIIISGCPKLLSVPQGFEALKNLQVLKILDCPTLVRRCQRGAGDDWHLISHIPIIYLDLEIIRPTSTVQKQPGSFNLSPSEEIKPASVKSPSEIVSEDHPSFGQWCMNINAQPTSIPVTHHPETDAIGSENRGASIIEEPFERQVLELENKLEGKRILFLFREGYEFEKEMVIQLWMALGVLTDEPMEEIGTHYFEKLVSGGYLSCTVANFYEVNTGKLNTEVDMITDKQNYDVILDNETQIDVASTNPLHVSVVCDKVDESIFTVLGRFNRLKMLLFLRNYGSRLREVPRDLFLCYESLVALDLSGAHIKELPSSAEKMTHLRFLDLSWTFIELLPERIYCFKMLQTLKLKGCSRLYRLPKEMKGLTELRHLDLDVLGQLATFPEGIGALVRLRTLSAFPVGTEDGLTISELKYLDNLTGEFSIANLENVQSAKEAKGASLTAKKGIKKLELRWSDHQFQDPMDENEAILENLRPCSDLEEIQILCYPGTGFPAWITDVSFHRLVGIRLFRCVHVSELPSLEKLPALRSLELISLNSVQNVNFKGDLDHVAFPKLQKLVVDEMLNVESWEEAQEGDYPCLVNLSIEDCPMLPELPSLLYLSSIKHVEVSGCTKLAFVCEKVLSKSLQQLIVEDCPLIKERCSKQGDRDWHKIEHIPTIQIDLVAIKTNEEDLIEDDDDESYHWDVFE